jgi:hypothetical protein
MSRVWGADFRVLGFRVQVFTTNAALAAASVSDRPASPAARTFKV